MTSVPVTSLGIRSGVNWMRLNDRCSDWASELTSKVLAKPGTPSSNAWPRAKIATSTCSITSILPDDHFGQFVAEAFEGLLAALHGGNVVGGGGGRGGSGHGSLRVAVGSWR